MHHDVRATSFSGPGQIELKILFSDQKYYISQIPIKKKIFSNQFQVTFEK